MTVLLVLAVFAGFVCTDLGVQWMRERRARRAATVPGGAGFAAARAPDAFELPPGVGLHPQHLWARAVDPVTVAVGLDDLAARVVGRATGFVMPVPGTHVRSGARGFRVRSEQRAADLASPVDGTVVEVNSALDDDPGLCVTAPYGRGWLCKLRVADAESSVARLRRDDGAARWLRAERSRLGDRLGALAVHRLAADGGEPVHDLGAHLDQETWEILVNEFLAADSRRRSEEDGR